MKDLLGEVNNEAKASSWIEEKYLNGNYGRHKNTISAWKV